MFDQPCRCFDGKLCQIYGDRPARCRAFECGLLQRVQAGEMLPESALVRIVAARKLVETIRRLLRRFGDRDETSDLMHRYARMMSAPLDLAANEAKAGARGQLMLAMNDLMRLLQRDFLK